MPCASVCVFIKLHTTAQLGPVIRFGHSMPLALALSKGSRLYLSRKPLIRRDKGDTLSLLVRSLLGPCMYVCVYIYQLAHNRAIQPCHPSHSTPFALILLRGNICACLHLLNCPHRRLTEGVMEMWKEGWKEGPATEDRRDLSSVRSFTAKT